MRRMIKSFVFEFPDLTSEDEAAAPRAAAERFSRYVRLRTRDEALDFDGIMVSAPHFGLTAHESEANFDEGLRAVDRAFSATTAAQVDDKIIQQCRTAGFAHFMAGLHHGSCYDDMRCNSEIFWNQLVPTPHKAVLAVQALTAT